MVTYDYNIGTEGVKPSADLRLSALGPWAEIFLANGATALLYLSGQCWQTVLSSLARTPLNHGFFPSRSGSHRPFPVTDVS